MANVFRALARSLTPLSGLNDPTVPLYQAIARGLDGVALGVDGREGLPAVTPENAARITAVYRAVSLIASISRLPLHVYEVAGTGRRPSIDPRYRPISGRPNPEVPRSVFWETVISHIALAGNAYIYTPENGLGDVAELWPIAPQRVQVGRDPVTRRKVFVVDGDRDAPFMGRLAASLAGGARGENGDLVHIPGLSFNGLVGINPIAAARRAAQLALAAEEYGSAVFSEGSLPGGIITTEAELEPAEAEELARRWEARHRGLGRARRVAVMDNGAKWQPTSIAPEDAQFLSTRQFQVQEIARLFGVPPHLLADSSGSTSWGSGLEEQTRSFVTFTLSAYSQRIEEQITDEIIMRPGFYARFNYAGLMRGNTLARYQAYAIGRTNGWLNADEIRAFEDMEPLPDGQGEVYVSPLNLTPVTVQLGDPSLMRPEGGDGTLSRPAV